MTNNDLLETITYWQSVHAENPQELIKFLIHFSEKLNRDGIEYAEEVADLEKKNQILLKKLMALFLSLRISETRSMNCTTPIRSHGLETHVVVNHIRRHTAYS